MAAVPKSPSTTPWPFKLEQKQGLRLGRGEVILLEERKHAVVGFDGRDEAYLCWQANAWGSFDTSRYVSIDRARAHAAPLNPDARGSVPRLPELDHTGRVAGDLSMRTRTPCRSPPSRDNTPVSRPINWNAMVSSLPPQKPSSPTAYAFAVSAELSPRDRANTAATTGTTTAATTPPGTPPAEDGVGGCGSGGFSLTPAQRHVLDVAEPMKVCAVIALYRVFKASLSGVLSVLASRLHYVAAQQHPGLPRPQGCPQAQQLDDISESSSDTFSRASSQSSNMMSYTGSKGFNQQQRLQQQPKGSFEDLQITIPIVKPSCWKDVQPLVEGKAVTFDERGWKETMTVRPHRWSSFVDRQKAKLERDIYELRQVASVRQLNGFHADPWAQQDWQAGCTGCAPMGCAEGAEDDIAELEGIVERMEDWKDLSRYSGKSISMASTRRGNEMKIHVLAFAEREDGGGVDFMRLSYKKSVEVRHQCNVLQVGTRTTPFSRALCSLLPSVFQVSSQEIMDQWVQLLQRPDVAKFTIALAFRNALASDGVHLQICDAPLNGSTS